MPILSFVARGETFMASEEVISCPACRHALRVPADWLGTQVQCPECKSTFRAPTYSSDGRLGEGVLVTDGGDTTAPRRRKSMLMLPGIGFLLLGSVSLVLNLFSIVSMANTPEPLKKQLFENIQEARTKHGIFNDDPPDEKVRKNLDEARVVEFMTYKRWGLMGCAALAAITFAGGLAIVTRRFYGLALLSCVAATLNLSSFCCLPGAPLGLWALVLLLGSTGREHFRRLSV